MAVDPDEMEEIVRETVDLYRAAERAVTEQVTRRLVEGLDAPDWAARRLGALSTLRTSVERILTIVQRAGAVAIRAALAAAYRAGSASALFGIPARLLPRDPDTARAPAALAGVRRAAVIQNLAAALIRDIGERSQNVLRDVLDAYRKVVAQATAASVAGGITRREASQIAYARFVDRGLTSFADRAGRRWRLTSYVEMALRTVTQRAAVQGQTDRQLRLGLKLVVISNTAQECSLCLVPGTVVEGPVPTWRTRLEYTGNVISIATAGGKHLTGTPNHPVLTPQGWVRLDQLSPGDQVISHNGKQSYPGVVPDDVQVPALIEEAGESRAPVLLAGPTRRDLDSDIAYREVRAMFPDGYLLTEHNTALPKPLRDLLFVGGIGAGPEFLGSDDALPVFDGQGHATCCCMSRVEHLGALLRSGLSPAFQHALAGEGGPLLVGEFGHVPDNAVMLRPGCDFSPAKVVSDDAPAHAEGFAELLGALPGEVTADELGGLFVGQLPGALSLGHDLDAASVEGCKELPVADVEGGHELLLGLAGSVSADEVVDISVGQYSGHVWDLSTEPAWFVANGIVTHNCRPFEGKVLRLDDGPTGRVTVPHQITGEPVAVDVVTTLQSARERGLFHPNCRHSARSFLPGVTKQPEQPTADPEGDLARQRQRAIERNIRRWKEREQAALTPEAKAGAKARVRKWQTAMRDHLKANPELKRLTYREAIGGGNLPRPRTGSGVGPGTESQR